MLARDVHISRRVRFGSNSVFATQSCEVCCSDRMLNDSANAAPFESKI